MTMILGNGFMDKVAVTGKLEKKNSHLINDASRALNFGNVSKQVSFNDGNNEGYYKVRPKALKSSEHNPRPDWVIDDRWLVRHVGIDMDDIFESNMDPNCLVKINEQEVNGSIVEFVTYPEFKDLINSPNISQKKEYDFLVTLSKSIRETGQIQPIEIESNAETNTLVVLEGHLRRLACILGRIPYIKAIRNEGLHELSKRDKIGRQITENSLRTNISAYGNYKLAIDEINENPKITVRELRERLKIKTELASVLLKLIVSPEKYHPVIFEVLKEGHFSTNNLIKVTALDKPDRQEQFISKLLKKNDVDLSASSIITKVRGTDGRKKSVATMQIRTLESCIKAGNRLLSCIPQLKNLTNMSHVSSVEEMNKLLKSFESFLLDSSKEDETCF